MDNEEEFKEILEETLELAEENNKILRRMQRAMRWGRFFSLLYWLIIIGSAVGAYYFLQPFIASFQETFQSFTSGVGSLQNVGQQLQDLPDLGSILKDLVQ